MPSGLPPPPALAAHRKAPKRGGILGGGRCLSRWGGSIGSRLFQDCRYVVRMTQRRKQTDSLSFLFLFLSSYRQHELSCLSPAGLLLASGPRRGTSGEGQAGRPQEPRASWSLHVLAAWSGASSSPGHVRALWLAEAEVNSDRSGRCGERERGGSTQRLAQWVLTVLLESRNRSDWCCPPAPPAPRGGARPSAGTWGICPGWAGLVGAGDYPWGHPGAPLPREVWLD